MVDLKNLIRDFLYPLTPLTLYSCSLCSPQSSWGRRWCSSEPSSTPLPSQSGRCAAASPSTPPGVVLRFVLLGGHQNWLKRVQHILLFHQKSTHTSAVFISFYRAWSWISHLSNFGSVGIQTGTWLEPGMANWACLSVCMPIPATVHAVLFLFWIICRQIKTDAKYH